MERLHLWTLQHAGEYPGGHRVEGDEGDSAAPAACDPDGEGGREKGGGGRERNSKECVIIILSTCTCMCMYVHVHVHADIGLKHVHAHNHCTLYRFASSLITVNPENTCELWTLSVMHVNVC